MWTLATVPSSVGLAVEQLGPAQVGRAQGGPSPGRCPAGRKEAEQGRLWALTPHTNQAYPLLPHEVSWGEKCFTVEINRNTFENH